MIKSESIFDGEADDHVPIAPCRDCTKRLNAYGGIVNLDIGNLL